MKSNRSSGYNTNWCVGGVTGFLALGLLFLFTRGTVHNARLAVNSSKYQPS